MEFMFRQVLNAPGDGGMLQQHIVSAASDDCQHQRVQQHVGWNQRNGTGQKCSTPISETNITKRNNAFPKQADILHLAEGDQGSNELEEDCVLPEHVDSLSPHRTDSVSPHRTDSVSPHNTDSFPPDYTDSVLPNNEEMTNFLRGLGMHKDLPNEPVSFQISSMSEKSSYMDEEGLSLLQGACEALNQWQQEYDTSRGKDHIKEKQRDTSAHWDISARVLKRETTPNTILDIRDRWEDGERVRVLRSLGIIDVESNPCFDNLTRIIQGIFQVSICAITVIDRDVVYIKSRAGQFVGCAPRVGSFCDWVLESSSPQMLVVEDAINDQRFRNCRFVRGPPYVKFYVGCPLVGSSGTTYGTLVIMDVVPRSFGANEYSLLSHFASIVVKELERNASVMLRSDLGAQRDGTESLESGSPRTNRIMDTLNTLDDPLALIDASNPTHVRVMYANASFANSLGLEDIPSQVKGSEEAGFEIVLEKMGCDHAQIDIAHRFLAQEKSFTLRMPAHALSGDDHAALDYSEMILHVIPCSSNSSHSHEIAIPLGIKADRRDFEAHGGPFGVAAKNSLWDAPISERLSTAYNHCKGMVSWLQFRSTESSDDSSDTENMELNSVASKYFIATLTKSAHPSDSKKPVLLTSNSSGSDHTLTGLSLGPMIASGSMTRNYRGNWKGHPVVVKIIDNPSMHQSVADFNRGSVDHPNVLKCYAGAYIDRVTKNGYKIKQLWYVEQFADRGILRDAIHAGLFCSTCTLRDKEIRIVLTALDIAKAIQSMHREKFVHGSINGLSVSLITDATEKSRGWRAMVSDPVYVGHLKERQGPQFFGHLDSNAVVSNLPPEVLLGQPPTPSTDAYSFGVLLWEMWKGMQAWPHLSPQQVLQTIAIDGERLSVPYNVPKKLGQIMSLCLSGCEESRPAFDTIVPLLSDYEHLLLNKVTTI